MAIIGLRDLPSENTDKTPYALSECAEMTDGDCETGGCVNGTQYMIGIDLGAAENIKGLKIDIEGSASTYISNSPVCRYSSDNSNWTLVSNPVFTDTEGPCLHQVTVKFDIQNARYFRVWCGYLPYLLNIEAISSIVEGEIIDEAGIDDDISAFNLTDEIIDEAGIDDDISAFNLTDEIIDEAGIDDDIAGNKIWSVIPALVEAATVDDEMLVGLIYDEVIEDVVGFAGALALLKTLNPVIEGSLGLTDFSNRSLWLFIYDNIFAWPDLKWGWRKSIEDSVSVADLSEARLGILISEWLLLAELQTANWKGIELVDLELILTDHPIAGKIYAKILEDGLSVADTVKDILAALLLEKLILSAVLENTGIFQHQSSDAIVLDDLSKFSWFKEIADAFSIADSHIIGSALLNLLADSVGFADASSKTVGRNLRVDELNRG
jgi:hypothetical protein